MSVTLIGKKIGMTRLFAEDGKANAVTVVSLEELTVCGHRTEEKDGYNAVILGYDVVPDKKLKKSEIGFFKKNELPLFRKLYEIRTDNFSSFPVGEKKVFDFDKLSKKATIVGKSIGKGFAGAMKRHNFSGLRASHGVSISHRAHGSTGACQDPGRVFKGKKMAGQMGNKRVTVKNVSIARFDAERSLLFFTGAVPGHKNATIQIKLEEL